MPFRFGGDAVHVYLTINRQAQHLTKREVEGLPKGVECTPLGNGMYRTRPKTEKGRRAIPLPEALADQLLAYIERHGVNGDGLVFHDDEGLPLTGSVERRRCTGPWTASAWATSTYPTPPATPPRPS